jgi:hypothetical protein
MKFRQDYICDEGQNEEDVGDGAADGVCDTGDARLEQNKFLAENINNEFVAGI